MDIRDGEKLCLNEKMALVSVANRLSHLLCLFALFFCVVEMSLHYLFMIVNHYITIYIFEASENGLSSGLRKNVLSNTVLHYIEIKKHNNELLQTHK